jgi:hypothetical protein
MFRIGWLAYVARVIEACLVGVFGYTALWLLGVPVAPIGYGGAAWKH